MALKNGTKSPIFDSFFDSFSIKNCIGKWNENWPKILTVNILTVHFWKMDVFWSFFISFLKNGARNEMENDEKKVSMSVFDVFLHAECHVSMFQCFNQPFTQNYHLAVPSLHRLAVTIFWRSKSISISFNIKTLHISCNFCWDRPPFLRLESLMISHWGCHAQGSISLPTKKCRLIIISFQEKGVARTPAPSNGLFEVHPSLSRRRDLSPIERLLVELLEEIFMLCISHSDYPPLINELAEPPISLCCVCKSWQKVASGFPGLWSAAFVCTDIINLNGWKKLPQILDRWFSRSNGLPLSFKFTSRNHVHEKVMGMFTAYITPFLHRFRHLDVDLLDFVCSIPMDLQLSASQPTQMQTIYPDISWSTLQFPQLESAIIRDNIDVYSHLETPLFPFAPRLQRLCMDSLSFIGGTPLQLILPWSQLTHLILVSILESHVWLQLFPMCPNLQHGLFDVYMDFTPTPTTAERVTFHHLVDLTFGFSDPINPSILGHFDFPALKTLRLQNDDFIASDGGDDMFWTASTHSRLCQQVTLLERLSLSGIWPFVCIFEAAAHVVELDLYHIGICEAVLSSLHRRSDGYSLLPNLRVLSMNIGGYSESQTDALANTIKSRRYVERGIEKLTLYPLRVSKKYVKRLTRKFQSLRDNRFIVEICDTMPSHWYRWLESTATAWREGIIDIEEWRRGKKELHIVERRP